MEEYFDPEGNKYMQDSEGFQEKLNGILQEAEFPATVSPFKIYVFSNLAVFEFLIFEGFDFSRIFFFHLMRFRCSTM